MLLLLPRAEAPAEAEALVICLGSESVQVGFAGDDHPSCIVSCVIARPLAKIVDTISPKCVIGQLDNPLFPHLSFPIKGGFVESWDEMEKVWHDCFYNILRIAPEEHPVMLSRPPLCPKSHLEKMKQIMFETFNTPAMKDMESSVLSLYAYGRTTGVTVELGAQTGYIAAVYEGYALPHAIVRLQVTGDVVTDYLMRQLGIDRASAVQIKESVCYVADDYEKELQIGTRTNILEKHCLTNKGMVRVNTERFQCAELLFQEAGSLAQSVHDVIMKCDKAIRGDLWAAVGLSGGSSLFAGLRKRLESEVGARAPSGTKVRVLAAPERRCQAWIGGSIFASLSTFQQMWHSKQEYDESGPSIVHRKCFGGGGDYVPTPLPSSSHLKSGSSFESVQAAPSCGKDDCIQALESKRSDIKFHLDASQARDFCHLPTLIEALSNEGGNSVELHPTVITTSEKWTQKHGASFTSVEKQLEKQQCYDLLDVLTSSGCVSVQDCSVHVVIASTHCLQKTLHDSLVQDNIDILRLVDSSHMSLASVIHCKPLEELLIPT